MKKRVVSSEEPDLIFFHLFFPGHGGFTACLRDKGDHYEAGFAGISPDEPKIRRGKGCRIAMGRLNTSRSAVVVPNPYHLSPEDACIKHFRAYGPHGMPSHAQDPVGTGPQWWHGFWKFLMRHYPSERLDAVKSQ